MKRTDSDTQDNSSSMCALRVPNPECRENDNGWNGACLTVSTLQALVGLHAGLHQNTGGRGAAAPGLGEPHPTGWCGHRLPPEVELMGPQEPPPHVERELTLVGRRALGPQIPHTPRKAGS